MKKDKQMSDGSGRQLPLLLVALATAGVVSCFGSVDAFASENAEEPAAFSEEKTEENVGQDAGRSKEADPAPDAGTVAEPMVSVLPDAASDEADAFPPEEQTEEAGDPQSREANDTFPEETKDEAVIAAQADSAASNMVGDDGGEADPLEEAPEKPEAVVLYRMYHPFTGEHFYTTGVIERNRLAMIGWKYEGIGWSAPKLSDTPVYRLYNPILRDHHYTTGAHEKDALVGMGWKYEGIGWYSDDNKATAVYRQFNPKLRQGSHNFTIGKGEVSGLVARGWKDEGVAWYGILDPDPEILYPMTIADGVDFAKVYDYEYYKENNKDVVAVYGNNDGALLNHFVNQGLKEFRSGNGVFNLKSYIYEYRDLRGKYKENYKKYCEHYGTVGYSEGRHPDGCTSLKNPDYYYAGVDFAPIFDYEYFTAHNKDVVKKVGITEYTLVEYFAKNGLKKAQQAKTQYNGVTYNTIKDHFYPPHDAMYYIAQKFSSPTNWLILLDRGARIVQLYTGSRGNWTENKRIVCDVGKPSTPTVTGEFNLGSKMLYFLTGEDRCWYASQITGGYLFHSVIYDGQSSPVRIVDGTLGAAVSHGCVRMEINNAKYIYDNVPSGSKIYIYN